MEREGEEGQEGEEEKRNDGESFLCSSSGRISSSFFSTPSLRGDFQLCSCVRESVSKHESIFCG